MRFPCSNVPTEEEDWSRDNFKKFIGELEIRDVTTEENGTLTFLYDKGALIIPKKKYREKASIIIVISISLYYFF